MYIPVEGTGLVAVSPKAQLAHDLSPAGELQSNGGYCITVRTHSALFRLCRGPPGIIILHLAMSKDEVNSVQHLLHVSQHNNCGATGFSG